MKSTFASVALAMAASSVSAQNNTTSSDHYYYNTTTYNTTPSVDTTLNSDGLLNETGVQNLTIHINSAVDLAQQAQVTEDCYFFSCSGDTNSIDFNDTYNNVILYSNSYNDNSYTDNPHTGNSYTDSSYSDNSYSDISYADTYYGDAYNEGNTYGDSYNYSDNPRHSHGGDSGPGFGDSLAIEGVVVNGDVNGDFIDGQNNTYITVYNYTYVEICSTGLCPHTTTIYETCTVEKPVTIGPNNIPKGFTTTVTVCHVCAESPMTVTLTVPCHVCEENNNVVPEMTLTAPVVFKTVTVTQTPVFAQFAAPTAKPGSQASPGIVSLFSSHGGNNNAIANPASLSAPGSRSRNSSFNASSGPQPFTGKATIMSMSFTFLAAVVGVVTVGMWYL